MTPSQVNLPDNYTQELYDINANCPSIAYFRILLER